MLSVWVENTVFGGSLKQISNILEDLPSEFSSVDKGQGQRAPELRQLIFTKREAQVENNELFALGTKAVAFFLTKLWYLSYYIQSARCNDLYHAAQCEYNKSSLCQYSMRPLGLKIHGSMNPKVGSVSRWDLGCFAFRPPALSGFIFGGQNKQSVFWYRTRYGEQRLR